MKKLIEVLKKIEDMGFLIAELEACGDEYEVETVEDLADYLEFKLCKLKLCEGRLRNVFL